MTGETQKIKRSKPILGLLQTSKSLLTQNIENKVEINDIESQHLFEAMERTINDDTNAALNHVVDKNPIINKRILLKVNYEHPNNIETDFVSYDLETDLNGIQNKDDGTPIPNEMKAKRFKLDTPNAPKMDKNDKILNENVVYDKIKVMKQYSASAAQFNGENGQNYGSDHKQLLNEGRIVVYGDSNCLDSTHIEKPCFWLLDALLEYTMTSHIPTILKDLNRSPNIQFTPDLMNMPKRLPNNNLHMYSKVLQPPAATTTTTTNDALNIGAVNDGSMKPNIQIKRPIPKCNHLKWETPIFLNISAPADFHILKDDLDGDGAQIAAESNLRRKLESQKGEVCSVQSKIFKLNLVYQALSNFL